MGLALTELPQFLILEPSKGVRLVVELASAACEIDVELDSPKPGRSFIVTVGHVGGPMVQRVRLAGPARIYFAPERSGEYVLILSNPMDEPAVIRLAARDVPGRKSRPRKRSASRPRKGTPGRSPKSAR